MVLSAMIALMRSDDSESVVYGGDLSHAVKLGVSVSFLFPNRLVFLDSERDARSRSKLR
jgi:hypothetical protein